MTRFRASAFGLALSPLLVVALLTLFGVAPSTLAAPADAPAAAVATDVEPAEWASTTRLHTMDGIFFASQPQPADFAQAQRDGVKTVINLRHEEETDFDEPTIVDELGLGYVNLPFAGPDELTDAVFDQARELLATTERPFLLHCGSSNRVGAVWLPFRVLDEGVSWDEALAEAKTIGLKTPAYEELAKDYIDRHRE